MAPFVFTPAWSAGLAVAIGFLFGFVLERAGFGNARNLAAQFYLYDMRVLKVMFTAIVTAMVLALAASAVGLLDFQRVWVPPTHLWPAVVGGLLLGFGFIVGGYCPGTSLVAGSTLKIDGILFALGVAFGLLVFGQTVPAAWDFFNTAGYAGRLTLFGWLGVDAGWVVLGVVVMAVAAFWFAELAERLLDPDARSQAPSPRARVLRRGAVAAALGIAAVALVAGQPGVRRKMAWRAAELDRRLASRQVHVDPAELLGLMHNNQVQLTLLDVRSEADYNLFHLLDARRVTLGELEADWSARLGPDAIVVVMSNDERAANEAWKRLAVEPNVNAYVLAGGVNRWLDVYRDRRANVPGPDTPPSGDDTLRHRFATALGQRLAAARPDQQQAPKRHAAAKVKSLKPVRVAGGGCG